MYPVLLPYGTEKRTIHRYAYLPTGFNIEVTLFLNMADDIANCARTGRVVPLLFKVVEAKIIRMLIR